MPKGFYERSMRGRPRKIRPKETAPLRKVIKRKGKWEKLECGHWINIPESWMGGRFAKRRRCFWCERPSTYKRDFGRQHIQLERL